MPLTRLPRLLHRVRGDCPDGHSCPAIYAEQPGEPVVIVGKKVTDPADLGQMKIGDDEGAVEIPAKLFPEAAAMNTDPAELGAFVGSAQREIFRLETLPSYDDGSDGSDYQRYIRGEPGPDPERKAAWHKVLQGYRDRLIDVTRVRVIHTPPTPYERYSCEWGYALNVQLEDIRVIAGNAVRLRPLADSGDFWLLDGERAALMHYDEQGRYIGFTEASRAESARCLMTAWAAIDEAVPFTSWWDSHRELRRENRHAA
jgi:hypothetical protein